MACYRPLVGWVKPSVPRVYGPRQARKVFFGAADDAHTEQVLLPCGACDGCALERARQWAVRCMHEAQLHDENCFITLTYAPEHLPEGGSLDKDAFQLFMKRLRKSISPRKVRYFHVGEYGSRYKRPHYHALLFGYDFPDKVPWARRGDYDTFTSAALDKLWPYGLAEIGSVTFESASYLARYMTKDSALKEYRGRLREYQHMSRNPGLGSGWFDKFGCEVYAGDGVVVRGALMKPPRYYDLKAERIAPMLLDAAKARRMRAALEHSADMCDDGRLAARERVAQARAKLFRGSLDL